MAVAIVDEVEMESFDDEHNNGGSENLLAVTNRFELFTNRVYNNIMYKKTLYIV